MGFFDWFRKRKQNLDDLESDDFERKMVNLEDIPIDADHIPLPGVVRSKEECIRMAREYCEEYMVSNRQTEEEKQEYHLVNQYITDIQKIEALPAKQRKELTAIAKKTIVLCQDKEAFKSSGAIISGKQFSNIMANENQMHEVIKKMGDDEKYCQTVKIDMKYLDGEIHGLKLERKALKKRLANLREMAKMALIVLSVLLILFIGVGLIGAMDTEIYTYILIAIAVIATAGLFLAHGHTVYQIRLNEVKMNKAIGMSNKMKMKFVNVLSGLEYSYKKYEVQNVYELSNRWMKYIETKKEKEVYRKVAASLYDTNEKMIQLLESFRLYDAGIWVSQAEALVEPRIMSDMNHSLMERRQKLKESLEYNSGRMERLQEALRALVSSNKGYADDMMAIIEKYEF